MDVDAADKGDDPVVAEWDVYVTRAPEGGGLWVVQYPLKPKNNPLGTPESARLKPRAKVLELKHPIEQDSPHYDIDVPNDQLRLESITHRSSTVRPATTYAIGVLDPQMKRLHLVPVQGIMQMRPSLAHLRPEEGADAAAAAAAAAAATSNGTSSRRPAAASAAARDGANGAAAPAAAVGASEEKPAIQHIGFKKKESERAATARKNSWAHRRQVEDAEPWQMLEVRSEESAEGALQEICKPVATPIQFVGGDAEYLQSLPHLQPQRSRSASVSGAMIDLTEPQHSEGEETAAAEELRSHLIPGDLLLGYLKKARILSFEMAQEATRLPAEQLIRLFPHRAVLLRGNWVISSELAGQARPVAGVRAVPAAAAAAEEAVRGLEIRVRNLILCVLHFFGAITRSDLRSNLLGVSQEFLDGVLNEVAEQDYEGRRWVPRLRDDPEFAVRHPRAYCEAEWAWQFRKQELSDKYKEGPIAKILGPPTCAYPGHLTAQLKAMGHESLAADAMSSERAAAAGFLGAAANGGTALKVEASSNGVAIGGPAAVSPSKKGKAVAKKKGAGTSGGGGAARGKKKNTK